MYANVFKWLALDFYLKQNLHKRHFAVTEFTFL